MSTIATTEPTKIFAGDTLTFKKTLSDYPASQGWQLSYKLRGPANYSLSWGTEITASGDDFLISVPGATTATWNAGDYWFFAWVSKGADRFQIISGEMSIKPNPATATTPYDGRTHAQKVLAAIRAMMEQTASREEESLEVTPPNGTARALKFFSRAELTQLYTFYLSERQREITVENLQNGKASGQKILTRFTTPQ